GWAFGTGSHPTTRLCLRWLAENVDAQASVLDYGCGSGFLAIAAAKLGARRVAGVDVDPQAIAASRANAVANGVAAGSCPGSSRRRRRTWPRRIGDGLISSHGGARKDGLRSRACASHPDPRTPFGAAPWLNRNSRVVRAARRYFVSRRNSSRCVAGKSAAGIVTPYSTASPL